AEARLDADVAVLQAGEAIVRQREAAIEPGKERLTETVVLAPLTGVVTARSVATGEFVREQMALFTVVVTDPLKYTGTLAERAAPEIHPGQAVRLTVAAPGNRAFPGEVTRVGPVADAATRTRALE